MFALGRCSHGNRKISRQKRSLTYRTWPLEAPPHLHVVRGGNRWSTRLPGRVKYGGWFATRATTVAMKACLDLPGDMLANGALVKLRGPIIRLVDNNDYRNTHGKHSAMFGSGWCLPPAEKIAQSRTSWRSSWMICAPQRAKGFKLNHRTWHYTKYLRTPS